MFVLHKGQLIVWNYWRGRYWFTYVNAARVFVVGHVDLGAGSPIGATRKRDNDVCVAGYFFSALTHTLINNQQRQIHSCDNSSNVKKDNHASRKHH